MKIWQDLRAWGVLVAILVVVFGYVTLPNDLKEVKEHMTERDQELEAAIRANEVKDKEVEQVFKEFIVEQRTIQVEQNRREDLLLEWLKETKEK